MPADGKPAGLPFRTLFPLSAAAFCSAATVRVADPLIPQISEEFAVPVSDAAIIATAFTLSYGLFQIVYGRFGDRAGKVTVIACGAFVSGLGAIASAFADGLPVLALLRFAGGCTAGAIIPLAIAHVGDVTSYEQRQEVLAKFLSGQVLGIVMGQALGGIIGEHIGWRGVFAVFGGLFLVAAALLALELASGRVRQTRSHTAGKLLHQYRGLLALPRVRLVIGAVFLEGFLFFGGVHLRRRLSAAILRPRPRYDRPIARLLRRRRALLYRPGPPFHPPARRARHGAERRLRSWRPLSSSSASPRRSGPSSSFWRRAGWAST